MLAFCFVNDTATAVSYTSRHTSSLRGALPVLDRYAYLRAGGGGPLGRGTLDAMLVEEEAGLQEGRGSHARFMRLLDAREELRGAVAALVRVPSEQEIGRAHV